MVFYKVYKGFIGGVPYSVRYLIGYSILHSLKYIEKENSKVYPI